MTNQEAVEKLVGMYDQVQSVSEDIKAVLDEAKQAGLDYKNLAKVAKAKSAGNLADLHDKTETLLNVVETFV